MKITIISPAHPLRGGIAASSERLALEFQMLGHEVNIITFSKQYPGLLFPGKTQFSSSPAPENLKIISKIHSYNPINWIKTGIYLRKLDTDLIIIRYWIPFMAPALGSIAFLGKAKRKVIALVDNIIPHEKHFYDAFLSGFFARQMDAFVVMSKSVKEELRAFTKKDIAYFPHPIYDIYGEKLPSEVARDMLKLEEGYRYILFFGFIRDYKGLDLLLQALAEEQLKKSKVKLIVAGEFYGNQEKYEKLIVDLDIQDRVILHSDFIPDESVRLYFSAAELLVQPYKTATQSGIAQIAYHFELPMIVTNVGGLPEIVIDGKSGYVVEKDPGAIAKAVARFFKEQMGEEFEQGTRELKEKFSWTRLAGAFLK